MNRHVLSILAGVMVLATGSSRAELTLSKDEMVALTSKWQGERYPDGRPKVPEQILQRMKKVSLEEAWDVLRREGLSTLKEHHYEAIMDTFKNNTRLAKAFVPQRFHRHHDRDRDRDDDHDWQ